jgi:SAM-dependent methyltransferase
MLAGSLVLLAVVTILVMVNLAARRKTNRRSKLSECERKRIADEEAADRQTFSFQKINPMGFGIPDLRFLLSARNLGFDGKRICTLGHLTAYTSQRELDAVLKEYGEPRFELPKDRALYFAEDFLTPLGFSVDSMDASAYEGATIIHDLNKPIPDDLIGKYDLVIDGGTLEHVFNFPAALENAMRMLKVGGHLFLVTPANNQCGHGFYQFSPELFFRALSPVNGFDMVRLYMTGRGGPYHVADPALVHGRVELLNADGAHMMVHAKKLADLPLTAPQQSDYLVDWERSTIEKTDGKLKSILRKALSPSQVTRISKTLNKMRVHKAARRWKRVSKLSNRQFYLPVNNWSETTSEAFENGHRT